MSEDRRRGRGSVPAPVEPAPSDTLPFAATITPFRGPVPAATEQAASPSPSPDATMDLRAPGRVRTPSAGPVVPGPAAGSPPLPDGTLDLPEGDRVDPAASLDPGQRIGRFVIRRPLGEGGMGVVLAGHDADLGRPVAIKLVRAEVDRPAYRARLLREAQALALLEHPNVVRVYEVGSDRGRLFVAMELVDGVTLTAWLRARRRSHREVIAMFVQIGEGLAAVHRAGLVHRDFKPDNVLIDHDGRARVADLGLARLDDTGGAAAAAAAPALAQPLTRSGVRMGTPGYMAPEQQYGADVDARADQYSYCVALREALLGGHKIKLDNAAWRGVPPEARAVVERGLAFEPGARFPTMDELLRALRGTDRRRATAVSAGIAVVAVAAGIATTVAVMPRGGGRPEAAVAAPVAAAAGSDAAVPAPVTPPPRVERIAEPGEAAPPRVETIAEPSQAPPPSGVPIDPIVRDRARATPSRAASGPAAGTPAAPSGTVGPGAGSGSGSGSGSLALPVPPVQRAPRKPEAWPSDPGHLAVVRATIASIGYDGFDPSITAAAVAQLTGVDQAIGKVKLGMLERRNGDCAAAVPVWTEARQALPPHRADTAAWHARASIGLSLCALAAGKAEDAHQLVLTGFVHGNQNEVRLIMAIAAYEKGDMRTAQGLFFHSLTQGGPVVAAAVQIWLDRTGLVLP